MNQLQSIEVRGVMLNDRLFYEIGLLVKYHLSHKEISNVSISSSDPLSFKLDLLIKDHTYHFEIVFPRYFPFQPIIVKSLETKRLSKHQYTDGSMCLKWGIDNWHENINIKNILDNLIELISIENPYGNDHGIAESGDQFSLTQEIQISGVSFIIDESDFSMFKKKKGRGTITTKVTGEYVLHFIKTIDNYKKHYSFRKNQTIHNYTYLKIDTTMDEFMSFGFNQYLPDMFDENDLCIVVSSDKRCILALHSLATEQEKERHLQQLNEDEREKMKNRTLAMIQWIKPKYINEEMEKRIQISPEALKKKIAIIGLGSIGSRVLMDLARAGFSNFLLCDDDIFMPNNIVRHELLSDSVGEYKIVELAKKIHKHINPKAKIELQLFALNGQQSTLHTQKLLDQISSSDLVIDCTANSNLIFSINEIVNQKDLNFISGSVISGGLGNILIIREKGRGISLIDLVESQKKFFRINNLENFLTSDYSGKIGNTEYVATMSDCSIISGLIGKNAIHLLSEKENEILPSDIYVMSTSNNFLEEAYSYYPLIGNKSSYIPKKLSKNIILLGKKYYENNYPEKTN